MAQVDELCFDNLDEFINDENKVVTYKWLSRSLSINVNLAKQALYKFLTQQRNEKHNDDLFVTYFLSGLFHDGDSLVYKAQIVPEQALESAKSGYTHLTSCHVYSVQKGKLKDSNSLYIVDYDLMKEHIFESNRFSSVKHPSKILRSDEEIEDIQIKTTNKSPVKPTDPPSSRVVRTEKNTKKPNGIAGMFAKSVKKQADTKETQSSTNSSGLLKNCKYESVNILSDDHVISRFNLFVVWISVVDRVILFQDVSSKTKNKSKPSGLTNFFSKRVAPKAEQDEGCVPRSREDCKTEDQPNKNSQSEMILKNVITKGKKKKVDSDEDEPILQEKKRRRVRQIMTDSSSSEDEMEIDEPVPSPTAPPTVDSSPDEIPPTPSPEVDGTKHGSADEDPQNSGTHGRIRKRKLTTKTSVDEDGLLVTEKVIVDEWEDVTDEKDATTDVTPEEEKMDTKTKKPSAAPSKVSPVGHASRKQTALTSFFKKK
ncbi:hypothetical protein LSH36_365g00001 [Paralvinella palmiformis]|uniref:DNA polymerase delta subunit 3 n=1 Tax=Paralvinella palmiformis TaxID=53620 RepID=A0AAD9MZP3_9ANNE|nr:hypothetical protein LSH36_365g00001 [Paralvinella palmiformis]